MHWQPLVFHTWKVVGRVVGGRCLAQYEKVQTAPPRTVPDSVHQLNVQCFDDCSVCLSVYKNDFGLWFLLCIVG
jgi:hypothetical protein